MGLRETLEAATPREWTEFARRHADELAALVLDMGEDIESWLRVHICDGTCEACAPSRALLARLDQLGKEQT